MNKPYRMDSFQHPRTCAGIKHIMYGPTMHNALKLIYSDEGHGVWKLLIVIVFETFGFWFCEFANPWVAAACASILLYDLTKRLCLMRLVCGMKGGIEVEEESEI